MSLTLIGDPMQTLYLFRDANPDILTKMDKLLPGAQEGFILKNYRSPKQLVELSNKVAQLFRNKFEVRDSDPYNKEVDDFVEIKEFYNTEQEASYVSKEIASLIRGGVNPKDISILARTNRQLLDFEAGLITERIPYIIKYDSRSVLNQSAFKVIYSIFSLMLNPKDINALCEVILPLKGVGSKFIEQIRQKLNYILINNRGFNLWDFINSSALEGFTKQYKILYTFMDEILFPARKIFEKDSSILGFNMELMSLFDNHIEFHKEKDSSSEGFLKFTIERDSFLKAFSTFSKVYKILMEDIDFQKLNNLDKFVHLYQMLQLSQESYFEVKKGKMKERNAVSLSTIHSFKGKENPYIFGVGLRSYAEKVLSNFESLCVFYVLVTRSKRKLYLTYSRYIRGFKGDLIRSCNNEFLEYYKGCVIKFYGEE